ncbi:phytanoyl-CoA dioxygenase family protein [Jannaschia sp. M317]|uniref:phytanoyl-CoA dioxygenase family protein n=1 Tax=Jannaschia sp. M317 TaxID=2867011 RepID=UPI0021A30F99|nr:phytanoyl-CoA dioxygenase family protein [Jannaschia sp. M317]UWQ16441.1 phytanoyl-CoA dioxygenase family protein [Jannaschia sp. M317]
MALTKTQVETFHRRGYLVVKDVLSPDRRATVMAEYDGLLDTLCPRWGIPRTGNFFADLRAAHLAGVDWFQPLDISLPGEEITAATPFHAGPAVFDMMTDPALLDVVEGIVGPEITSTPIQHVRIKPPARQLAPGEARAHVGGTAWHQDRGVAHAEADETTMVTVWIAMTDATEENGCLIVQPFDGPQGMLPHCPLRQTAIPDSFLDADRAVALPVKAGDILLLHPMIPHASLDNTTEGFRWSFDLRYQTTGQPTGRAHFPDFIARSADRSKELRDARAWRESWVAARIACAGGPHVPIHRWTSASPNCA